jgi:uncharacterized protein (DUF1330 family)
MAAYLIVCAKLRDEAGFQPYVAAVGPLIGEFGGTLIARSTAPQVLEGISDWSTVGIVRFETMAAATAFWTSDQYTRVKELRREVADFEVILVPAVEPVSG